MQGPSTGAVALVPTQVSSQVPAYRQSSSLGRALSRVRLQALPKLPSAEVRVICRDLSLFIISLRVSQEGDISKKLKFA